MPRKKQIALARPDTPAPARRAVGVQSGMRVELVLTRGDVTLRAETAVENVLTVGTALVMLVRELARQHPDILPHVETVPGDMVMFTEGESYDAKTTGKQLGFQG